MAKPTDVYLERGSKRVFACALDFPGWCRSARTEELALQALADYGPRYAVVARQAGVAFPTRITNEDLRTVERLQGKGATDFGVPNEVAEADARPLTGREASRQVKLVEAAWAVLDQVAAGAPPTLRKGPRGGGRDRDKMLEHVLGAEAAYARKLGVKHPQPALGDAEAIASLREAILAVLRGPSDGSPPVPRGWPVRYAARRIAWHVLDHAWEMEDRSHPDG
jgi:hypothetical protein